MVSGRGMSRWPIFEALPGRPLPPLERWRGGSPAHATTSRPLAKAPRGGPRVVSALAAIAPTPGIVVTRLAPSSPLAPGRSAGRASRSARPGPRSAPPACAPGPRPPPAPGCPPSAMAAGRPTARCPWAPRLAAHRCAAWDALPGQPRRIRFIRRGLGGRGRIGRAGRISGPTPTIGRTGVNHAPLPRGGAGVAWAACPGSGS